MTMTAEYMYRFRSPTGTPEERLAAPPRYRREVKDGMIIERDVRVELRDGVHVYADIFRPEDEVPAPVLIAWGPYGKHGDLVLTTLRPAGGVAVGQLSPYTTFESPDPVFWVSHGYVIINVDMPGTWYSGGHATFMSPEEAQYGHDFIEWAAAQSWSNTKVGLSGVSYLTVVQWTIAATNPPHLAAINPWEGWTDTYRDVVRHGGIPETNFWAYICKQWGYGTNTVEDLMKETAEHPFFDNFWASKAPDLSKVTVPAYVVASYSDQGLHTRGTFEGFKRIGSQQKWLDAHGRKKWGYYYSEEGLSRQLSFFDHFLKGEKTDVLDWPTVRYEVRERPYVGKMRTTTAWPPPEAKPLSLYLDGDAGSLRTEPAAGETSVSYDSEQTGRARRRATFDLTFAEATELAGGMRLRLWMSAEMGHDMDVFVALQKLDVYGDVVGFPYYSVFEDGPVALGWLRASHRELDEARSTALQPFLAHRRELLLEREEIVPLNVEILTSATRFEPGETLRVVIQGKDIYRYPRPLMLTYHDDSVNRGLHSIYSGGRYDSQLIAPIVRC